MGFFEKVKEGLSKTRSSMSAAWNAAVADFTGENEEIFDDLEEMLILSDAGVETAEDIIQKLRDKVIHIARDDPRIPAGTVFQADLIGLPVRSGGVEIGRIAEILSMPASEVWVVKGEREYMIPNVKAFVPGIDLSLGYVEVNLIEGMNTDAD